jgi:hypothetical protein
MLVTAYFSELFFIITHQFSFILTYYSFSMLGSLLEYRSINNFELSGVHISLYQQRNLSQCVGTGDNELLNYRHWKVAYTTQFSLNREFFSLVKGKLFFPTLAPELRFSHNCGPQIKESYINLASNVSGHEEGIKPLVWKFLQRSIFFKWWRKIFVERICVWKFIRPR